MGLPNVIRIILRILLANRAPLAAVEASDGFFGRDKSLAWLDRYLGPRYAESRVVDDEAQGSELVDEMKSERLRWVVSACDAIADNRFIEMRQGFRSILPE